MKRFFHISGSILLIILILICIPFTIPKAFGLSIYEVITDSMTPKYPVGSVIYVEKAQPEDIKVDDVITFSIGTDTSQVMTHRVVAIDSENHTFTTKGDANKDVDVSPVAFQRLLGKPMCCIKHMGFLVQLFESSEGRVFLGVLLVLVFVLWFAGDHIDSEVNESADMNKKDRKKRNGRVVWKLVMLMGAAMVLIAGWNIYRISKDYSDSNALYSKLSDTYVATEKEKKEEKWYDAAQVNLQELKKQNGDVTGWLYFENEDISYPIMYSGDDTTYLHTALDGSYASAGSIFMEENNHPDFQDSHTIIYGHNMRNLSMFGKLRYYKQKEYYDNHAYFQIFTDKGIYRYQIFAYADVPADSFVYQVPYGADDSFKIFIQQLKKQSYYDTDVEVTQNDKVVTLSTCSTTGMRFIVNAVRVDEYLY